MRKLVDINSMNLERYQEVVLTQDIPNEGLCAGDVATLVDYVPHPSGGEEGAILEIFNAVGESLAVVTVPVSAIGPLTRCRRCVQRHRMKPTPDMRYAVRTPGVTGGKPRIEGHRITVQHIAIRKD